MRTLKKKIRLLFVVIISVLFGAVAVPNVALSGECGEVSITEMDWASSQIITEVVKFLMENGYGCEVKKVPSSTVPAAASLAENGKPDIVTEMWMNSSPVFLQLEKEGKVEIAGDVLSDGGVEGWWIPEYLAKKHPELTTIEGILKNPQLVGGRFHNCPVGWGCRTANDNYVVAFGFKEHGIEVFNHGSGETLAASIAAAYADKKPWFGYYWAPTAVLGKYPMIKVDVGPYNKEIHDCARRKGCTNPKKSAYPSARVVTGIVKRFAYEHPEVYELLQNLSFPNKTMNSLLAWKENNNASSEEAAVRFLSQNSNIWKIWVNVEARKKLAPLL